MQLEYKFCKFGNNLELTSDSKIVGYASVFNKKDQGKDIVQKGAFSRSLASGRKIKLLWQHDPKHPIGVWDDVHEDDYGLFVKGRLLTDISKGREAATLLAAGAIDGLSVGYRAVKATKDATGSRILSELDLWEVSLVTFPMLADARASVKNQSSDDEALRILAQAFDGARQEMSE